MRRGTTLLRQNRLLPWVLLQNSITMRAITIMAGHLDPLPAGFPDSRPGNYHLGKAEERQAG